MDPSILDIFQGPLTFAEIIDAIVLLSGFALSLKLNGTKRRLVKEINEISEEFDRATAKNSPEGKQLSDKEKVAILKEGLGSMRNIAKSFNFRWLDRILGWFNLGSGSGRTT